MRRRRHLLLLLPAAMLLARCGSSPKPPAPAVLHLTMVGSAGQNPDRAGRAAPVAIKVYQLTSTDKFTSVDWTALSEREPATLGQTEAAPSQQFMITPGETQTQTVKLGSGVTAVGIVALYRDIDRAQWRATAPVADHGPTNLTLNIGSLAVRLARSKK